MCVFSCLIFDRIRRLLALDEEAFVKLQLKKAVELGQSICTRFYYGDHHLCGM